MLLQLADAVLDPTVDHVDAVGLGQLEELLELRRTPDPGARVLLRAERGVIGRLLDCDARWCFLDIAGTRGWAERAALWGVLETEMRD